MRPTYLHPARLLALLVLPLCWVASPTWANAQGAAPTGDGSYAPIIYLEPVLIEAEAPAHAQRAIRKENRARERLYWDLRKVYPYAREAKRIIDSTNHVMDSLNRRKTEKDYLDALEKDLFNKYKQRIRQLTLRQGKLLIKLIDRETDQSAYALIKDYKSGGSAFFWQTVARLFGTNLKEAYNPEEEAEIEELLYLIQLEDAAQAAKRAQAERWQQQHPSTP